jgi:hypothetical protein
MPTVALLLSPSEQPIPRTHARRTSFACGHLGPILAAHALGQHGVLTSLAKHIGDALGAASGFRPSNSAAIVNGVIGGAREGLAPPDKAWGGRRLWPSTLAPDRLGAVRHTPAAVQRKRPVVHNVTVAVRSGVNGRWYHVHGCGRHVCGLSVIVGAVVLFFRTGVDAS